MAGRRKKSIIPERQSFARPVARLRSFRWRVKSDPFPGPSAQVRRFSVPILGSMSSDTIPGLEGPSLLMLTLSLLVLVLSSSFVHCGGKKGADAQKKPGAAPAPASAASATASKPERKESTASKPDEADGHYEDVTVG